VVLLLVVITVIVDLVIRPLGIVWLAFRSSSFYKGSGRTPTEDYDKARYSTEVEVCEEKAFESTLLRNGELYNQTLLCHVTNDVKRGGSELTSKVNKLHAVQGGPLNSILPFTKG
jgi:hypothetical protein